MVDFIPPCGELDLLSTKNNCCVTTAGRVYIVNGPLNYTTGVHVMLFQNGRFGDVLACIFSKTLISSAVLENTCIHIAK